MENFYAQLDSMSIPSQNNLFAQRWQFISDHLYQTCLPVISTGGTFGNS